MTARGATADRGVVVAALVNALMAGALAWWPEVVARPVLHDALLFVSGASLVAAVAVLVLSAVFQEASAWLVCDFCHGVRPEGEMRRARGRQWACHACVASGAATVPPTEA